MEEKTEKEVTPEDIAKWIINEGFGFRKRYPDFYRDFSPEMCYMIVFLLKNRHVGRKRAREFIEVFLKWKRISALSV